MYLTFRFEIFRRFLQLELGEMDEEQADDEAIPEPVNAGHPIIAFNEEQPDQVGFHLPGGCYD